MENVRSSSLVDSESLKKICTYLKTTFLKPNTKNIKYVIIISALYNMTDYLKKCVKLASKKKKDYKKILKLIEYKQINIINELFNFKKKSCIISNLKKNLIHFIN